MLRPPGRAVDVAAMRARNEALARQQHGVVSRAQLLASGLTSAEARRDVESGRWQRLLPGVYATHTGAVDDLAQVWAAILHAGTGAVASHETALWLVGAYDAPPPVVHVCVPGTRQVRRVRGVRHHRRTHLASVTHPSASPPRMRVEDAVLAVVAASARPEDVVDVVLRVTQRRLTTADRLRSSLADRPRIRWRALLSDLFATVEDGVASVLELRYARDVEQRHGLPKGRRNLQEPAPDGRGSRYRDVRYLLWRLIVELDGRGAHPEAGAFRDRRRDNAAALDGDTVLRYGWREVAGDPCGVAGEVVAGLRVAGWTGTPRQCGPQCRLPK